MNLLSALPWCDLTYRDFSECAIPHAYLYKRDLTGSKFNKTQLNKCIITDARLDSCDFIETDLRNLKYGRYTDFKGHTGEINCLAFSPPDGKFLVSGSADKTLKLWNVKQQKEISTI